MKRIQKMKKTISMKQFVLEFGQEFSQHIKDKLLMLSPRCILTRAENSYTLDLKHVEHIKYDCVCNPENDSAVNQKEYVYGQFIMDEGNLYFSESCLENENVMQASVVKEIFNSLATEEVVLEGVKAKKLSEDNINYVVDALLKVCPEVSKEHQAILSRYMQ